MYDLLTIEEDKQAAAGGWSLEYVYDTKTSRWVVQILPRSFMKPFHFADAMAARVVGMARMGDPLSIKALRLMAAPVTRKKTK